jgi:hypothetical protein
MAKDTRPWVKFFGNDFYASNDVQGMNYEQQGMYVRLCWLCWRNGDVPEDQTGLADELRVAALSDETFTKLRRCFRTAGNGRMVHPKTEEIRAEVEAKSETARGLANRRWGKKAAPAQTVEQIAANLGDDWDNGGKR